MKDKRRMLSFVIPARDEAASIGRCVDSIMRCAPRPVEVIVADNGSRDGTADRAREATARVVRSQARTVGAVRNDGARAAEGDVLVFVDADCTLTPEWGQAMRSLLDELRRRPMLAVGAQVFPPPNEEVFLWKYWFLPFVSQESASHVGSANLALTRETFRTIGGFAEHLETGEDYDLCTRLVTSGGAIMNVPSLRVEHHGFPRTLGEFVRRERWHGRGDTVSLAGFVSSKVAVASSSFATLIAVGLVALVTRNMIAALLALGLASALVVSTSVVKLRHAGPRVWMRGMLLVPFYFSGRALAVLDALVSTVAVRRRGGLSTMHARTPRDHRSTSLPDQ